MHNPVFFLGGLYGSTHYSRVSCSRGHAIANPPGCDATRQVRRALEQNPDLFNAWHKEMYPTTAARAKAGPGKNGLKWGRATPVLWQNHSST